jgi:hypothetical protein
MSFPRFAGGKFIANCLSLSRHTCPTNTSAVDILIQNPTDYEFRFGLICQTIPKSREDMKRWIKEYEFSDTKLYGQQFNAWSNGEVDNKFTEPTRKLVHSGLKMFITCHGGDRNLARLTTIWKGASVIQLINHRRFSDISCGLKTNDKTPIYEYAGNYSEEKYVDLRGSDWPSWKEFEEVGYDIRNIPNVTQEIKNEIMGFYNWSDIDCGSVYTFNVDGSIFDRSMFLKNMSELYDKLGFDDFNSSLMEQFWKSYMCLHIDMI